MGADHVIQILLSIWKSGQYNKRENDLYKKEGLDFKTSLVIKKNYVPDVPINTGFCHYLWH